jgi:hypothetical protein
MQAQTNYVTTTNSAGVITSTPISVAPALVVATEPQGSLSTNGNFFGTVFSYFTSFNPALAGTFAVNNDYQAWVGASYQSGVYLGGVVGLEAQPFGGAHGLTFRNVDTLAPTVGTLSDAEFDIGYSFVYVDLRITPFAGVDDNILGKDYGAAFGVEIEKALTSNTFAGAYIEGKSDDGNLDTRQGQMVVGLMAGATF